MNWQDKTNWGDPVYRNMRTYRSMKEANLHNVGARWEQPSVMENLWPLAVSAGIIAFLFWPVFF